MIRVGYWYMWTAQIMLLIFLFQIFTCCCNTAVFTPWTAHCVWASLPITSATCLSIGDKWAGICRRKNITQVPLYICFSWLNVIWKMGVDFKEDTMNMSFPHDHCIVQYLEHLGHYKSACHSRKTTSHHQSSGTHFYSQQNFFFFHFNTNVT